MPDALAAVVVLGAAMVFVGVRLHLGDSPEPPATGAGTDDAGSAGVGD